MKRIAVRIIGLAFKKKLYAKKNAAVEEYQSTCNKKFEEAAKAHNDILENNPEYVPFNRPGKKYIQYSETSSDGKVVTMGLVSGNSRIDVLANAARLEAMRPELLGATRGPVTDSRPCIDIQILRQAAESLLHNFGDLSDLPFDLANTVANIYYRFLAVGEYIRDDNRPDLIEPFLADSDADISGLEFNFNMLNLLSESTSSFKHIDACVKSIRDVRNEPKLHKYIVRLTLDVIKFNIKAADSKSPLWRAIERLFKRPREIPNLLDCMITEGYRLYGPAHR